MIFNYLLHFFIFSFFLFLAFQTGKFFLYCLYVWQLVEYRPDRLWSRLTNQGDRMELTSYLNILNLRPLHKYPRPTLRIIFTFFILIFLTYQLFFFIYRRLVKLIPVQDKFTFTLFVVTLIIYWLVPVLVSLVVLGANLLLKPMKKLITLLAKKKIEKAKNLLIIGITGSYGKSLTKEVIAEALSLKFKVLKTPASTNTEMGIAKTILYKLRAEHQIFVVEMGAYKKGEIAKICELVKPRIGIISGINEQHLALFGNLKNTIKAKSELLNELPADGLALFNSKNKYCRALFRRKWPFRTLLYGVKSKGFEESLDSAFLLAKYLKIPLFKIKKIIRKLKRQLELKKIRGRGGILIFDDSYSSNPHGFYKALTLISQEKRKKILVTPGIIELGQASEKIHRQLGRELIQVMDKIIITSENFAQAMKKGAGRKAENKFLVSNNELRVLAYLRGSLNRQWLVLLEGRIPLNIRKIFLPFK